MLCASLVMLHHLGKTRQQRQQRDVTQSDSEGCFCLVMITKPVPGLTLTSLNPFFPFPINHNLLRAPCKIRGFQSEETLWKLIMKLSGYSFGHLQKIWSSSTTYALGNHHIYWMVIQRTAFALDRLLPTCPLGLSFGHSAWLYVTYRKLKKSLYLFMSS